MKMCIIILFLNIIKGILPQYLLIARIIIFIASSSPNISLKYSYNERSSAILNKGNNDPYSYVFFGRDGLSTRFPSLTGTIYLDLCLIISEFLS